MSGLPAHSGKLTGTCVARPIGACATGDRISFPEYHGSAGFVHGTVKGTQPLDQARYRGLEAVYVEEDEPPPRPGK